MSQPDTRASERVIAAIRDHVVRVSGQRLRWIMVHDIARSLALDGDVVGIAMQAAIDRGWLVGDSDPPDSVRLSAGLAAAGERPHHLGSGSTA